MATAEFSEFSFGYALTDSLVSALKPALGRAPIFPSLIQEGSVGGGYDLELPAVPFPIFLQFKIQQVLKRRSKLKPIAYPKPYYRMPLRTKEPNQHQLLLDLGASNPSAIVLYATPLFHTIHDLDSRFLSKVVHQNTAFIDPAKIGILDDGRHHLAYAPGQKVYWCHSEPIAIENTFDFDSLHQKIMGTRQYLRESLELKNGKLPINKLASIQRDSIERVWTWFNSRRDVAGYRSFFDTQAERNPNRTTREVAVQLAYFAQVHFGVTLAWIDAAPEQAPNK